MVLSFFRTFFRQRAHRKVMSQMARALEKQDKMIASGINMKAASKRASRSKLADKNFRYVFRYGDVSVKLQDLGADEMKAVRDILAALEEANAEIAQAKAEAKAILDEAAVAIDEEFGPAIARADAATVGWYTALGAMTVLPFGLGLLAFAKGSRSTAKHDDKE